MDDARSDYLALPSALRQLGAFVGLMAAEAAVATLVAAILQPTRPDHAEAIMAILTAGPLAIALAPYPRTWVRRAKAYPDLYAKVEASFVERESNTAREDLLRRLLGSMTGSRFLPLRGVVKDSQSVRLVIGLAPGASIGSELLCIQVSTGNPVGQFNVTAVQGDALIASEVRIFDGLWWGALHQRADHGELGAPGDTVVMLVDEEGASR